MITLAIGLSAAERASHGVFQSYARKHGLAFEVINTPRFRIRPNWFIKRRVWYHIEKFQLFEALERYERIIFLDSDILIQPSCPNLFNLVPEGRLGIVYDDTGPDAWKRTEELEKLGTRLGSISESRNRYFNSGVMVMDQSLKSLFEMRRKDFISGRWPEQTLLNYRVLRHNIPVVELAEQYNFMPHMPGWASQENRLGANVIHYAGQSSKVQMAEDFPHVEQGWMNPLERREDSGA
jgi:hypothetical protein